MSELSEYSKFDHLESSSSDEEAEATKASPQKRQPQQVAAAASSARPETMQQPPPPPATIRRHQTNSKRFVFEYANQPIYEFEQSLNEVVLYVPSPPSPANIVCHISAQHLQLGSKGADRFFLDEDTGGTVDTTESTWCLEDDDGVKKIVIYLQKMAKGSVWSSALTGRFDAKIDPLSLQQVQKEIMLERFQEEHPGMDFRDAQFNGSVPDPRNFMGGVSY